MSDASRLPPLTRSVMTSSAGSTPPAIIELEAVHRMARALTREHQCQPVEGQSGDGALIGNMHMQEVQPGLFMRLNRLRKRADLRIQASIDPSLKISIVWRGQPTVCFGNSPHQLKLGIALCIALNESTEFSLQSPRSAHEHSAILTLTPAWLTQHLGITTPSAALQLNQHLAHHYWRPSARLIERLDALSKQTPERLSQRLGMESAALEAISECLASIASPLDTASRRGEDWQTRLDSWIHSGEAAYLSQAEMAAQLGMSLRQLQRRYRDTYGSSLARDLRVRQLTRAAHLLMDRSVTVEAAAELAGYRSAANFATAFRRQFDLSPRQREQIAHRLSTPPTAIASPQGAA